MDTRFSPAIACYPPPQSSWSETPVNASRANEGAEGASSASQPARSDAAAGGAPARSAVHPEKDNDAGPSCTFEVLGAVVDCAIAAASRNKKQIAVCVASSGAAVDCLVQQFAKK
jgi:hypothetical protein